MGIMDRYESSVRDRSRELSSTSLFRRLLGGGLGVLLVLGSLIFGPKVVENVDANEIVLVQSLSGSLSWHTTPGWICQCFGKVTSYAKRTVIEFKEQTEQLPIAFNDNGRATLKGSMNYSLPLDTQHLTDMHASYPDQTSLERGLVVPAMNKSIFLTGTLMTSYESYKEKRSMLIQFVEDQVQHGVYRTQTSEREIDEEILGPDGQPTTRKKKITEVSIVTNNGQVVRNEEGQMDLFGVKASNFSIEDITYDKTVTEQIGEQQKITMAVQTSIANAKKAQQDALTAEAVGRANIAAARAEQEKDKTVAVVQAEKERDVQNLKAQQAEAYKKEQILRADADAEYKRRIIVADGALAQKLATYEKVNATWAQAFKDYKGALVPGVVMGGGTQGGSANAAQDFMNLLMMRTAKDLALDVTPGRTPEK